MEKKDAIGALAGLKVVDLSRVLAGPYCTQIFADHGAEVIKVEPPTGDETRGWGPPFKDGDAAFFIGVNRNKRTIAVDISTAEGRDVVLRLLAEADVLVENFKGGTLERWGLGYDEVLRDRFPRLIHCTITGFGDDGPWGGMPGYDLCVQAWAGLVSINGSPESGAHRVGLPLVDLSTGINAALGIMFAYKQRVETGRGQHVEVALFDVALSMLVPYAQSWMISGKVPGLTGNIHPSISPYSLHRTSGRSIFLTAGSDRAFRGLCRVLGKPHLAEDPRFLTNPDRVANRAALTAELEECMNGREGEELALDLMENGIASGAVFTVADAFQHPHTKHRNMVVEHGDYTGVGIPIRLSEAAGSIHSAPPKFAEHNDAILEDLGYRPEEIAALYAAGAVTKSRRNT